jgi:hypothetical protein
MGDVFAGDFDCLALFIQFDKMDENLVRLSVNKKPVGRILLLELGVNFIGASFKALIMITGLVPSLPALSARLPFPCVGINDRVAGAHLFGFVDPVHIRAFDRFGLYGVVVYWEPIHDLISSPH